MKDGKVGKVIVVRFNREVSFRVISIAMIKNTTGDVLQMAQSWHLY